MPNENRSDNGPIVPEEKAKQGLRGTHLLTILIVALVLAMAVWWGVEMYGGAIEPTASEQVGDPSTVDESNPQAPANPAPAAPAPAN